MWAGTNGTVTALLTTLMLVVIVTGGGSEWHGNGMKKKAVAEPRLVFVDSDGGSDDLLSVMQMVLDPNVRVLGIGCVYGNVELDQACANILRTLNFVNRTDIPVYSGCDSPMITDAVFDGWFGVDGMDNASSLYPLPSNTTVSNKHAVAAMIDIVAEYPGQVTFLSLGPLTNVAVALKLDPYFSFKLKDHVIMGGTMSAMGNIGPVAEFNFFDDPEAAVIVFSRAGFPIKVVPYELCLKVGPTWAEYDEWVSTGTREAVFLDDIYNFTNSRAKQQGDTIYAPCDLLTTTVLLNGPDVITGSTLRTAKIEQCGLVTRGQLVVDYRTTSTPELANINLITDLDDAAVVQIWKDLFTA